MPGRLSPRPVLYSSITFASLLLRTLAALTTSVQLFSVQKISLQDARFCNVRAEQLPSEVVIVKLFDANFFGVGKNIDSYSYQ